MRVLVGIAVGVVLLQAQLQWQPVWQLPAAAGLPYSMEVDDRGALYVGTRNAFLCMSTDRGGSWTCKQTPAGVIYSMSVAPDAKVLVIAGRGAYVSYDTGNTWQQVIATPQVPSIGADWVRGIIVFSLLHAGGIVWCEDTVLNCRALFPGEGKHGWNAPVGVARGARPQEWLVGHWPSWVWRTRDDGNTWEWIHKDGYDDAVHTLVVTPRGTILFGTTINGVWRSTDDGATWQRLRTVPDSISQLLLLPGGTVCAATNRGVFCSRDEGETWDALVEGLRDTLAVVSIAVDSAGYLWAGTFRRWIYRTDRPVSVGMAAPLAPSVRVRARELELLGVPAGMLRVELYSILGRQVMAWEGRAEASVVRIPLVGLPAGVYGYWVSVDGRPWRGTVLLLPQELQ